MGQMILGLDIGQSSIKGIRLTKSLRGLRLVDCFVHPILRDGSIQEPGVLNVRQIEALESLVAEGKIVHGDLIALSLPGDLISFREMSFPFSEPKKLEQIVPFEMEAALPFDLETLTVDYMVLKNRRQIGQTPSDEKKHPLLVAAIQNEILSGYLAQLQPLGIDPAWIGPNALSLYAYAQYQLGLPAKPGSTQDTLLVINIGASRTVLCSIYGGALQWLRTIPLGGDLLTESLKKTCQLTWEEAEARKKEIDLLKVDANPEEKKELAALEGGVLRWMMEVEKTIRVNDAGGHSASPQISRDEADAPEAAPGEQGLLHLCGGGSGLKGLSDLLSNRLERVTIAIQNDAKGRGTSVSGLDLLENKLVVSVYPEALGLAMQESEGPPLNFRKDLFVFGKETIERRHHFVTIGLIGLILLALLGGNLYLRYTLEEQRFQGLKTALRSAFTQTFPKVRNVVNEVEQTRTAIKQLKKRADFFGLDEKSPLLVLKEITEAIPEGVKIDVFNIVIDGGKVRIQAHTNSFESVDRIRGGLLSTKQFRSVEVSDAKVMADQKRVRFRIKMTIVADESS